MRVKDVAVIEEDVAVIKKIPLYTKEDFINGNVKYESFGKNYGGLRDEGKAEKLYEILSSFRYSLCFRVSSDGKSTRCKNIVNIEKVLMEDPLSHLEFGAVLIYLKNFTFSNEVEEKILIDANHIPYMTVNDRLGRLGSVYFCTGLVIMGSDSSLEGDYSL